MSDRLIDLIIQIKKKCSSKEEEIRSLYDLSHAEYSGIVSINENEKLLCSEFSERMELSASRGSRIIDKLIQKEFLNYESVPGDRRAHRVSLTEKGIKAKSKIEEKKTECEQAIISHYPPEKIEELKKNLEMLVAAI